LVVAMANFLRAGFPPRKWALHGRIAIE